MLKVNFRLGTSIEYRYLRLDSLGNDLLTTRLVQELHTSITPAKIVEIKS